MYDVKIPVGEIIGPALDWDRPATYDFHGPISYRFRDKRRFRSKFANQKVKKFDDTCIRLDTIQQRDGRTDRRTDRKIIALCMLAYADAITTAHNNTTRRTCANSSVAAP